MMNRLKLIGLLWIVLMVLVQVGLNNAQTGFKGIVPMKSTCYDVKTVFNGNCDVASESFKFPFEKVEIEYTTEKCQKLYGKKWNVPIGTVITLTRFFRKPI